MYSRLRSHQPPSSDADAGDPGLDPKFSAAACPSPGQLPVVSEATPQPPPVMELQPVVRLQLRT